MYFAYISGNKKNNMIETPNFSEELAEFYEKFRGYENTLHEPDGLDNFKKELKAMLLENVLENGASEGESTPSILDRIIEQNPYTSLFDSLKKDTTFIYNKYKEYE